MHCDIEIELIDAWRGKVKSISICFCISTTVLVKSFAHLNQIFFLASLEERNKCWTNQKKLAWTPWARESRKIQEINVWNFWPAPIALDLMDSLGFLFNFCSFLISRAFLLLVKRGYPALRGKSNLLLIYPASMSLRKSSLDSYTTLLHTHKYSLTALGMRVCLCRLKRGKGAVIMGVGANRGMAKKISPWQLMVHMVGKISVRWIRGGGAKLNS